MTSVLSCSCGAFGRSSSGHRCLLVLPAAKRPVSWRALLLGAPPPVA